MSSGWREKDGGQAATQMPHIACQDILGHPAKVWAGDRQPWTENLPDKTEREAWRGTEALDSCCEWSHFPREAHADSLPVPLQLSGGKENPEGTVPWNYLGEGSMGRRKEGEHGGNGSLAVQMQCSFPSRTSELPSVVI